MVDPKHLMKYQLSFLFRCQELGDRKTDSLQNVFKINNIPSNSSFLLLQQHLVVGPNITLSACPHTGNPKGVMLTHGNVVADFSGFLKVTDVSDAASPHTAAALQPRLPQNAISSRLCLAESYFPQSRWLPHFLPAAGSHVWKAHRGKYAGFMVRNWAMALDPVADVTERGGDKRGQVLIIRIEKVLFEEALRQKV